MSLDHACTLEWSYRVSFFLESVYKLPHCKMFHIFINRCPLHCITGWLYIVPLPSVFPFGYFVPVIPF
jgi:hypothetical protein